MGVFDELTGGFWRLLNRTWLPESDQRVTARRVACGQCGRTYQTPWGPHCRECLCLIAAKTRVLEERCPLGFW